MVYERKKRTLNKIFVEIFFLKKNSPVVRDEKVNRQSETVKKVNG